MFGIYNDNFPPILDGVALTAQNYAYWLNKQGKDVCVITPYAPDSKEVIDAADYHIYRYFSIPIPMRKPYRYGLSHIDPVFWAKYHKLQFELVHAHCPFTTGSLALSTARKQNIPIVATFHSKYKQDLDRAVPFPWLVDWEIRQIVHFYDQVDEVWIPQAAVEPTLREYGYKGHVEVVENGNDFCCSAADIADMRKEMREELGMSDEDTMLLFVGQHIWEKNIGFILDSLALMKERPYHLFMVGTGYAVSAIRRKISQLGLSDKVTMLGNIHDRDRLRRIDAAADLFLFPSLYDNAPLVVREAAAMRTPSLLLSGSTASEVVTDGDNGFLSPNDTQQYAQLIKHLMDNPELLNKVGIRASNTLARSWENVMEEVALRYRDIITSYNQIHAVK